LFKVSKTAMVWNEEAAQISCVPIGGRRRRRSRFESGDRNEEVGGEIWKRRGEE